MTLENRQPVFVHGYTRVLYYLGIMYATHPRIEHVPFIYTPLRPFDV